MARQSACSARFLSVPAVDWFAPMVQQVMAAPAVAKRRAASSMSAASTPEAAAARSTGHSSTWARSSSQPSVWSAR
ncbi:unannotated protein [freshwater metagenome]|uniref:Unannotated protein n=1 Tax=freshwater metagenome TaxID=449393 RepID=A0A6J7KZ43_9ZZZZ